MTIGAAGCDEGKAILKVNYTHDRMIDHILADPGVSQKALAEKYNLSQGWVSRVIASDAFQARLAQRRAELIDPSISRALDERLGGLAHQSLEVVHRKLEQQDSASYALEALGLASKALGLGNHQAVPGARRK